MPHIREVLKELTEQAKQLHAHERRVTLESVKLVGRLDRLNAAVNFGMTSARFAREFGLTENRFWKRVQVSRLITRFPEAETMLADGTTDISHLALLAPKMTPANAKVLLEGIKGKSCRETAELASRVTPSGELLDQEPSIEFRIVLTKSQYELMDRARAVLSHSGRVPSDAALVAMAFEELLERKDPMRKAARAAERQAKKATESEASKAREEEPKMTPPMEKREPASGWQGVSSLKKEPNETTGTESPASLKKEPNQVSGIESSPSLKKGPHPLIDRGTALRRKGRGRPGIPMGIKHAVMLRDGGRCTWQGATGERCPETMMLEVDHVRPWSSGGEHAASNLRLVCRRHHRAWSEWQAAQAGWHHFEAP